MMVMEDMLKDFLLGEHLLLVGNQVSCKSSVRDKGQPPGCENKASSTPVAIWGCPKAFYSQCPHYDNCLEDDFFTLSPPAN